MLIKNAPEIKASEITDESHYLRRREFIQLATGVAMYGQSGLMLPGPPAPWSELSSNLGFLLGGSLLAQVLSYAPFLGAQVLAKPNQRGLVADFIVGLFLSRLPILLFQAVQAALLLWCVFRMTAALEAFQFTGSHRIPLPPNVSLAQQAFTSA